LSCIDFGHTDVHLATILALLIGFGFGHTDMPLATTLLLLIRFSQTDVHITLTIGFGFGHTDAPLATPLSLLSWFPLTWFGFGQEDKAIGLAPPPPPLTLLIRFGQADVASPLAITTFLAPLSFLIGFAELGFGLSVLI
jgi:hypothetical protein